MPTFLEAMSRSKLHPTFVVKPKMFLKQACTYFSTGKKSIRERGPENVPRVNLEKFKKPLNEQMNKLPDYLFSSKISRGSESIPILSSRVKTYHAEPEEPNWRLFKDHLRELNQMYRPDKQNLRTIKSLPTLPRIRGKHLVDSQKIFRRKLVKKNQNLPSKNNNTFSVERHGVLASHGVLSSHRRKRIPKRKGNPHKPTTKPSGLKLSDELDRLLKRFLFTKIQAKRLKKPKQSHLKPKKTVKKGIINTTQPKILKKPLPNQKLPEKVLKKKLVNLWPNLVELGELEAPKNPEKLTINMRRKILKKLNRTAIRLPSEVKNVLKRRIKGTFKKRKSPPKKSTKELNEPEEEKRVEEADSQDKESPFKLGKQLKVHDYGFKKLKGLSPGREAAVNGDTPTDSIIQESEAISNRKVFRSLDLGHRSATRQTATSMFLNLDKGDERNISSRFDLLDQLSRLESSKNTEGENFEYLEDTGSPLDYDISEELSKAPSPTRRTRQTMQNNSPSKPDVDPVPFDFFAFGDFEPIKFEDPVPVDQKKPRPLKRLKKKKSKKLKKTAVPQADAGTQTICQCEICRFLQKYKTDKIPPLVTEMKIKQKFFEQRQFYMDNVRHRKFKVSDDAGQKLSRKGSESLHRSPFISISNHEERNNYLQCPESLFATYQDFINPNGLKKQKPQACDDYKAPNVSGMFSRCYQTLFEAEQRTNGMFSNLFYPKNNICHGFCLHCQPIAHPNKLPINFRI